MTSSSDSSASDAFDDTRWTQALDDALPAANLPTLLMVLLHLTGDRRWLSERYQCSRIRGLEDNDPGGLTTEAQQEVRLAAREAVLAWKAGKAPVVMFETKVEVRN